MGHTIGGCTLRRAVGENNKHRQDGRQTPQPILSFEDFFASKSSKDRQFLGVPAKKETMKKHDLAFADSGPTRARRKRRKRHPLGAGEHAAELG